MTRNKRRHNTSFGYIGSGNKTCVFNRKPRKVFSKIKDKLNFESHKKFRANFNDKKLSDLERKAIKTKIKKRQKEKIIASLIFSILLIILLIFALKYIIQFSIHHS